jgi:hypothetical protein
VSIKLSELVFTVYTPKLIPQILLVGDYSLLISFTRSLGLSSRSEGCALGGGEGDTINSE